MVTILNTIKNKIRSTSIEKLRSFMLSLLSFCSVLALSYYHHWLEATGLAVILSLLYAICRYDYRCETDDKLKHLEITGIDLRGWLRLYKDSHWKNTQSLYYLIHHIVIDLQPRTSLELVTHTRHPLLQCLFEMCGLMVPEYESSPTALKPGEYAFLYGMMDTAFSLYFSNIVTPVEGMAKFKACVDKSYGPDETLMVFPKVVEIINRVASRNNISLTEGKRCA